MGKRPVVCVTFICLVMFGFMSFVPINGAVVSGTIKPSYYNLWNPSWTSAHPVDFEIADDGYVYQVGNSEDPRITQNYTFHLIKWSPTAEIVWNRTWDISEHTQVNGLAVHNSFIYTAGYILTESGTMSFLVKWSSNGDILWSRIWSWTLRQRALDVDVDLYGNVFVLCSVFDLNETTTQLHLGLEVLLKYDATGTLLSNYSGGYCYGRDMDLTLSDNGLIYSTDPLYGTITQWDSTGVIQWTHSGSFQLLDVLNDGNYILTTPPHYTIRKIDSNKNEVWNVTDYTIWQEYYGSLAICGSLDGAQNGSVYLSYRILNNTTSLMILDKFSESGIFIWNKTLQAPETWDKEFANAFTWIYDIEMSTQGVLYVNAYFYDGEHLSIGLVVYGTPTSPVDYGTSTSPVDNGTPTSVSFQPDLFIIILGLVGLISFTALVIVVKRR